MAKKQFDKKLIIIILIALILRISFLDKFPPSFNMDEAAKGYNGFSLLKTGKSFRGLKFPFYFTDFSDKLPSYSILYTYSSVPFVALFGLNEIATRLPSVSYGVITIIALYFLSLQLFKYKKIAEFAALFLAISPWHILMSRLALEPITFPPIFLLGWFFLDRGKQEKSKYLYIGSFLLGLSLYTYQIALFITPVFITFFTIFNRNSLLKNKVRLYYSFLIFLIMSLPLIYFFLSQTRLATLHFEEVSVVRHGKLSLLMFLGFYAMHFNLPYLLFYYHLPVIYFATRGFLMSLRNAKNNNNTLFLILIFLITLIPNSLTNNPNLGLPQAARSIGKTGFVEIFAAYFAYKFIYKNKKYRFPTVAILLIITVFLNSLFLLAIKYPYYFDTDLYYQYGWKEVVNYISSEEDKYDKIVITNKANQPFIYILYYKKYPPEKFQTIEVKRHYQNSPFPYEIVDSFDKYFFCNIDECYDPNKDYLYIARENEVPQIKEDFIIKPTHGPLFRVIDNRN